MNRIKLFFVVLVLISFKTFACLNGETKILKNGIEIYHDDHKNVPKGHKFDIENFPNLILDLENQYNKTKDIDYLSDKGYVLILQKKYDEALKLYLEIEKIEPNRYSTASNLGTLYELMGENEKAYKWIEKSVDINSDSHNGSEWLHLKILEAKVKNLKNVSGYFLLNTDFGSETMPKTTLSNEEIGRLQQSLFYQLNERITFIEPKDEIIAVLLFELANISKIFKEENIYTLEIYELSKKYGYQNELINDRIISCYEDMLRQYSNENEKLEMSKKGLFYLNDNQIEILMISLIVLSVATIILLITCAVFFFKWKKLKNTLPVS